MLASEIVEGALEAIRQRGLHKGWYIDPAGRSVCAIGALRLAATGSVYTREEEDMPAYLNAANAIGRQINDTEVYVEFFDVGNLAPWSDSCQQPEVEEVFEKAAKDLRDRGE